MYDILVYLFENYHHPTAFPENKTLFRKLSAVGFENGEIREALAWLSVLSAAVAKTAQMDFRNLGAFRVFDESERKRLTIDCQNFLHFLENAGIVDAQSRELIIEVALSLKDRHFGVDQLKVVTLMALWSGDKMPDSLVIDELLGDSDSVAH